MEFVFTEIDKIGDIVARFPKAGDIFKHYNVDFCCGGNRPLAEAISEQKLNASEVLGQLNAAYANMQAASEQQDRDWQQAAYGEFIDHVVHTHHGYLHRELPKIRELTTKILRVHGGNHRELAKVHKLFHLLKMDLEEHLIKEEEQLFPAIKAYEQQPSSAQLQNAAELIEELESEHTAAGDILKEMRQITDQYRVPDDGCPTYRLTYDKLQELEADLFQHIHLENNIMFPRILREAGR
jgi:regulator of cell morphogenesis and NO signaling